MGRSKAARPIGRGASQLDRVYEGEEPLVKGKAITSLFIDVRTPLFQGGAALPPANPAISEPFFPTPFNGGLLNSCDSQPL